jgi:hypothetical protein
VDSDVDELLVRDISRVVIARVAPAEKASFRAVSDAYFANAKRTAPSRDGGTGPLGWGAGEAVTLLTPIVLAAMTEAIQYLLVEIARTAVSRGRVAAAGAIRRLFGLKGHPNGDDSPAETADLAVELTDRQWAAVRRIVVDVAQRSGLSEDKAALIGDAVLGAGQNQDGQP